MYIKYPLLIPIIGHGATDLIDIPKETLIYNFLSALLVYNLNSIQRKTLLTSSSIFHIAQDIPKKIIIKNKIINIQNFRYLISSVIHIFWIKKPIIAKLHLLCIHTPLHYLRCFNIHNNYKLKYILGTFVSVVGGIFLQKNYNSYFDLKYGELWYIGPIVAHILLNYKINQKYLNAETILNKNNAYYFENDLYNNFIYYT